VSSTQGTTDYISGIQYKSNSTVIDFIQTEEGRAINTGSGWNYEYTLSDNLGNNRVAFDMVNGKVGEDDYYPFGLNVHRELNAGNNYLYNKKELQNELSEYDYGARFYNPVIARWTTVDPLAEISRRFSPYNYGENNPISNIDPDGMDVVQNGNVTTYTGADIAGYIAAQAAGQADGEADVQKVLQQSDPGKKSKKQKKDQSANSFWSWSAWSSAIPVWNQAGIASDLINHGHYFGAAAAEINGVFELSGLTELGGFFYNGIGGLFTKEAATTTLETTAHGATRIAGTAATRGGVLSIEEINATKVAGTVFKQSDGATVYLHQVSPGRYNAVVENSTTGRIITTMENWSQKSINRIAKNYGWPIKQ